VALEGRESASNGSAADEQVVVVGGRADRIDEIVGSMNGLTRFGSGDKLGPNPLPNVVGSRGGHAAIVSGANQKAGPGCQIACIHRLDRSGHCDEDCCRSENDIAEHDHPPGDHAGSPAHVGEYPLS